MKMTAECKECGEFFSLTGSNPKAVMDAYQEWDNQHRHVYPKTREPEQKPVKAKS